MNSHTGQCFQGCLGLLRGIQSSEVAGMSSVWPSTLPNNPGKSLQAVNCNRKLPVGHYRHVSTPHLTPARCRAQLSSLSPHLPSLMTAAHSQPLFALGSCTQGKIKMPFSLLELHFVSPGGEGATRSHLQVRAVMGFHLQAASTEP